MSAAESQPLFVWDQLIYGAYAAPKKQGQTWLYHLKARALFVRGRITRARGSSLCGRFSAESFCGDERELGVTPKCPRCEALGVRLGAVPGGSE